MTLWGWITMSQINPFTGSILQTPQVQRQQSVDKDRQVRRVQDLAKNTALADDRLEHQVESSEELKPIHEDQRHERRFKRPLHRQHKSKDDSSDNEEPHVDLTA
jgi:hypothetical protein